MLLLRVAHDVLGDRCTALTAVSMTMARSERAGRHRAGPAAGRAPRGGRVATSWSGRGSPPTPPTAATTASPSCWRSPGPRAERLGLREVLLGTNLDDLGDHRPGLDAARERGARQPMVEAGLTKPEVRALSRQLGLPTWDKPQLACLSSRFPYGTEITPERLRAGGRLRGRPARRWASASCASATTARSPAWSWSPTP